MLAWCVVCAPQVSSVGAACREVAAAMIVGQGLDLEAALKEVGGRGTRV